MTFYDRYEAVCKDQGRLPCSEETAQFIGISKARISSWKSGTIPKADVVSLIAEAFNISADYLLGLTDDPTNWNDPDLIADIPGAVLDAFNGNVRKAVAFRAAQDADALAERNASDYVQAYLRLDNDDKNKVDGFIAALLTADKYAVKKQA